MTEVRGMNSESSPQLPQSPDTSPTPSTRRSSRLILFGLIAAVLVLATAILGVHLIDRAEEIVSQVLSDYTGYPVRIGRIALVSPTRAVLHDVEAEPVSAKQVHLRLSLPGLLRRDFQQAIRGFSLVDGVFPIAGTDVPLTFELEGDVVADGGELLLRLTNGRLSTAGEAWGVTGEARIVDGAFVDGGLALNVIGATGEGRLEVATLPHPDRGTSKLRVVGYDLPLVELWRSVAPLVLQTSQQVLTPPEGGLVDVDVTLSLDPEGINAVTGETVIRTLLWEPFELETVQVGLEHHRDGINSGDETGNGQTFTTVASIVTGQGRAFYHRVNEASGVVRGGPAGWSLSEARVDGADGAHYSLQGELQSVGEGSLLVEGEHVPIEEAVRWLPQWALVSEAIGVAAGAVLVELSEDDLKVSGDLDIGGAWIGNTRLAEGELSFATDQGGVRLSGEIAIGGGRVVARELVFGQALSGELSLKRVALPSLEALAQAAGHSLTPDRWRGRVSGSVRLEGSYEAPVLRGELVGERVGFQSIHLDRVELVGAWRGAEWEIETVQAEGPGGLSMAGSGHGRADAGYELNLEWRDLSAQGVGDLLDHALLKQMNLLSSGALRLYEAGGRTGLEGRAAARGTAGGESFEASFIVEGDFEDGIAVDGTMTSGEGRATALVRWSERESRVTADMADFPLQTVAGLLGLAGVGGELTGEIRLELPLDQAPMGTLYFDMDRLSLGAAVIHGARAHLDLTGSPPLPRDEGRTTCAQCLYGDGVVAGRIAGTAASDRSLPFEMKARLLGDEIVLEPTTLRLWGGRVRVGGGARMEDADWRVELTSEGSDLNYAGSGLSALLGYRVRLVGPVDSLRLEAEAEVKGGQVDLFQLQSLAGNQSAPLGALAFQIDLDIENFRVTARSLLDAELSGDLRVMGSRGQLDSVGEVQVVRGHFGYLGRRFEVVRGRALFSGGGVVPHLDVTGSVPTQGVTLYVDAVGPADDLSLAARTDPPVDADRLRAMMVEPLGGDPAEIGGDWRMLARILSSAFNRQVVSEFYWTLGRALEDALDIDLVAISPQGDRGLQLTLGKYVRSDLYLTYQRDVIHGLQEGVSLEYSLGPRSLLRTGWDRERGASLDVGVSVPF